MTIKKPISYKMLRRYIPKEDINDMVTFGIITPIDKTNFPQSWWFEFGSISAAAYKKLLKIREKKYALQLNELLASQIENEWSKNKANKTLGDN